MESSSSSLSYGKSSNSSGGVGLLDPITMIDSLTTRGATPQRAMDLTTNWVTYLATTGVERTKRQKRTDAYYRECELLADLPGACYLSVLRLCRRKRVFAALGPNPTIYDMSQLLVEEDFEHDRLDTVFVAKAGTKIHFSKDRISDVTARQMFTSLHCIGIDFPVTYSVSAGQVFSATDTIGHDLAILETVNEGTVQSYYQRFQSRLTHRVVMGSMRHCGFWPDPAKSCLRLREAQRNMHGELHARLDLRVGDNVLDAGCGSGAVAIAMADRGLRVCAVDLLPAHVEEAKQRVKVDAVTESSVEVIQADYHSLPFSANDFCGVYTMESLVHADNPELVLSEFYRVLMPGGTLVMHEIDVTEFSLVLKYVLAHSYCGNTISVEQYVQLLQKVGFEDVDVRDYTDNVFPTWKLLRLLAVIPNFFANLFGVKSYFVDCYGAEQIYKHWYLAKYVSVKAKKPIIAV